jgi:cyclic pyranopterin monophosphate synthase
LAGDFTHLDEQGQAHMVDVTAKEPTVREAVAEGEVRFSRSAFDAVRQGRVSKGDVPSVARIAGILGAKKTSDLIPLCHPIPLTGIELSFEFDEDLCALRIRAEARTRDRTGVEMEALTAVAVAALTVYDMTKSLDKGTEITGIRLLRKSGGKSGAWAREDG